MDLLLTRFRVVWGNPNGIAITQPRVARNELPWVGRPVVILNPERVVSIEIQ